MHPINQAVSRAATPADLTEEGFRRNPGEPDAEQSASSDYRKPTVQWRGLTIAIENPAGSVRRGRNRHGVTWEQRMVYDYGEIRGTMGVDGDPVDVFLGPYMEDAPMVYVVHQRKVGDWEAYDEDKCLVGFMDEEAAKIAFLANYSDPRFLGPITAMPVDEFVRKVRATRDRPAMVKAAGFGTAILFFKSHVGAYVRNGKLVNLAGYRGRDARPEKAPGQIDLFTGREHGATPRLGPNPYVGKHPVKDTPDLFDAPVVEPRQEMIAEHRRLVAVLRSPTHEDDKREAVRQAAELKEYEDGGAQHEAPAAVFDDALLDIAKRDTRNAPALIGYAMEGDAQGVIPGRLRELDRSIKKGRFTEDEVAAAWKATRDELRHRYGDRLTLYRADAPESLHNPETLTVYMADEATAKKYANNGRVAKPFTVPTDDVLAVYARPSGYFEAIVRKPMAPAAAPEPPVTPAADLPTGATIADSKGRQYRVHYMRHGLIVAHPIVDGKPQVSADTTVRFETTKDFIPSGDNDRTDPVTVVGMPDGYRMDGGRAVRVS